MTPIVENPFTWMYLPTALTLGALHALEPGHAKTLTAAYLIGIKGTKRDAFLLGLSVAATHSLVVIGLSVLALWIGREAFTQDATHWLQIGSGIIVIILGTWMLVRRIRQMRKAGHHHHAPDPVIIKSKAFEGLLSIVNTHYGERFQFEANKDTSGARFRVLINRSGIMEIHELTRIPNSNKYIGNAAPNEPHEFSAEFEISSSQNTVELFQFEMKEPGDHHDHSHMTDDEHARAHAANLPDYAKRGERPTLPQILAFGAAGGLIPCPASITVMLLALSIGQFASGFIAVMGFSIGLAITLVGIGLVIVAGISRLQNSAGRLHLISSKAPIISAAVVILSGVAALLVAH